MLFLLAFYIIVYFQ